EKQSFAAPSTLGEISSKRPVPFLVVRHPRPLDPPSGSGLDPDSHESLHEEALERFEVQGLLWRVIGSHDHHHVSGGRVVIEPIQHALHDPAYLADRLESRGTPIPPDRFDQLLLLARPRFATVRRVLPPHPSVALLPAFACPGLKCGNRPCVKCL